MKDSTACSDLLQDPTTIRLHECKNGQQIEAATDIIQQSASQLYQALHDRAKLLADSGQFEAALRDAVAMQTIRPTAALGYLCEGDVYCQQGRSEAAMAIYDKALEAVPASDPHYHDLQQQRQQRTSKKISSNKRIDFISELPIDVVSTYIIPRFMPVLLSTGCCPYLQVSHTWQQRILQHAEDLSVEVDYELDTFSEGHYQLFRIAPYVKSLDIIVRMQKNLVNLFTRAKFSSLKKLKLGSELSEPQLKGLAMVADTLTHLEVGFNSSLRLLDILRTCPNLTFLKTNGVDVAMPSSSSSSSSSLQYPRLTHLGLHSWSPVYVDMENLLGLFPKLVWFEITPMPGASVLPLLPQQCPSLRTLSYGREIEEKEAKRIIHVKGRGLTVVHLGEGDMFVQDDLIKFLSQHHQTLKELDLDIQVLNPEDYTIPWDLADGKLIHYGTVVPMSFPILQTLRVAEDDYYTLPCLQWILENAPQLESISIPESLFLRETARGLKQLKHLKKLHVNDASGLVDDRVIGPLLQHHAALGDRSSLEHIQVHFDTYQLSDIAWLPFVCGLKKLEKLDLFAEYMMGDCIPFLKKLSKGCPALDELLLGNSFANFEGGLITALGTHPNLRSLYIGAHTLSEYELRCLANFPKLERVYLCFPPSDSIRDYLPKRIQLIY